MVFNDNNDIFRNNNCDHIDRFRWCNKPENTRWVTSRENMNNKGICADKIDRQHDKKDIEYLEDWIAHINVISIKKKDEYLKSLNDDLQKIQNEIDDNIEKELEEKHKDTFEYLKETHDFNLINKTFTTMKSKMEKINRI